MEGVSMQPQLEQLIPDRVDYWLIQWARYCRHYRPNLGYPSKALGLVSGGESRRGEDVDLDFAEQAQKVNCQALDALVDSLPPSQCAAVRSVYLGEVWRFPRENQIALLQAAAETLIKGMDRRGVCL
jgi:hypothetical protein